MQPSNSRICSFRIPRSLRQPPQPFRPPPRKRGAFLCAIAPTHPNLKMSAIRIHPLRREPLRRWRLAHLALFRTRRHNRTMSPLPRDRPSGLARPKGFLQTQNDRRSTLEKAHHQPSQETPCLQATHCSPRKPNTPFCMDRRISAPPQH